MKIEYSIYNEAEEIKNILAENHLCTDDFEDRSIEFFVAKDDDDLITGVIALQHEGKVGLLRSFAVREHFRNRKTGAMLVHYLFEKCHHLGIRELYVLTPSADQYFKKFNFVKVDMDSMPEFIKSTKILADFYVYTGTLMRKKLR